MKRLTILLAFIVLPFFFTGCYTQVLVPERNTDYENEEPEYNDDQNVNEYRDSTEAGYRYYDDYSYYPFHYYNPLYSRYYWGYRPGRIGFYDYGDLWDNYWGYGLWNYSPFYYDYYWHTGYIWSYYWPDYYPRYYNNWGWGSGGNTFASRNLFRRERNNDGERLGYRRGLGERLGSSLTRPSVTSSGNFGRVTNSRGGTTLGKDGKKTDTGSNVRQGTRSGEKIYRGSGSSRSRGSSGNSRMLTAPRELKEVTIPQSGSRGSSSSGRSSTSSSSGRSRSESSYSTPPSSSSRGSSVSSSGRSSSSSSSSGRSSSSSSSSGSSSSRGGGGGGRGR